MTQSDFDNHLKLMAVSAQMAGAVMQNVPDNLPIDPEAADANVQTANGMMFRLTRTFAAWIVGSLGNTTYWPALPELTGGAAGAGLSMDSLMALLSAPGNIDKLKALVMGSLSGGGTIPPA